jgi:hypothetical protein
LNISGASRTVPGGRNRERGRAPPRSSAGPPRCRWRSARRPGRDGANGVVSTPSRHLVAIAIATGGVHLGVQDEAEVAAQDGGAAVDGQRAPEVILRELSWDVGGALITQQHHTPSSIFVEPHYTTLHYTAGLLGGAVSAGHRGPAVHVGALILHARALSPGTSPGGSRHSRGRTTRCSACTDADRVITAMR